MSLIDQRCVIAEIHIQKFGVTVQSHGPPEKCVKLAYQKISEIKAGEFFPGLKPRIALKKAIAMRPRNHRYAHIIAEALQLPSGAAVRIDDENFRILRAGALNHRFDGGGDFFGRIVEDGRQALQIHMGPAIGLGQG